MLRFAVADAGVTAAALQAAPTDRRTLLRRAGPDAPALQRLVVTVIGCGAVGSHFALLMGESGAGTIRTFAQWDEAKPGFLEVDLVAHCGGRLQGGCLYTITLADVDTGWTEGQTERLVAWAERALGAFVAQAVVTHAHGDRTGGLPALVRRNVMTRGIDLNELIGQDFEIQGVHFRGMQECSPCYWMDQAIAPGAKEFLKGRGGLRAKILSNGILRSIPQLPRMKGDEHSVASLVARERVG